MIKYLFGIVLLLIIVVISCNKTDDTPPIIFMNGADSLAQILNKPYVDPGATATDDTDGNITSSIYVDNQVNVDKVGWYTVTYTVIDEQGNEAAPARRDVYVYNEAYIYVDPYLLTEVQLYPDQNICSYNIITWIDSTINNQIIFENFACAFGQPVYVNVLNNEVLEIPLQFIADSFSVQGSGTISNNDSIIQLDYNLINDTIKTFWEAELIRY